MLGTYELKWLVRRRESNQEWRCLAIRSCCAAAEVAEELDL